MNDSIEETSLKLSISEIKVGDKVARTHENKGIISKILSRQDMHYLQDETLVDMVINHHEWMWDRYVNRGSIKNTL